MITRFSVIQVNGVEPKFVSRPKVNGPVNVGDTITVSCQIRADPIPDVCWKIGNTEIRKSDSNYVLKSEEKDDLVLESALEIKSVQMRDNGKSQISAKNILAEVTCPFTIIVQETGAKGLLFRVNFQNE